MAEPREPLYTRWRDEGFRAEAIANGTNEPRFREALAQWLVEATPEQRSAVTHAIGKRIPKDWTAAIAVGLLGERSYTAAILDAMAKAKGLELSGYGVAIETMRDEGAVAALMAMLEALVPERAWVLAKALQRSAGRAPLIDRYVDPKQYARAALDAWKRRPFAAPTVRNVARAGRSVTFGLDHGGGELHIESTPYNGGSWPRWSRALYVNDDPLYNVSSGCETCHSILQLAGTLDLPSALARYRAGIAAIELLNEATIEALRPLIDRLQTGHYMACLANLEVDRVTDPARSWLAETDDDSYAPRTVHFQSKLRAPAEKLRSSVLLVPSQDLSKLDEATVSDYERAIRGGARPVAIALTWVEDRSNWDDNEPTRTMLGAVLDGHHKLAAYARARVPARILTVTSLDESTPGRDVDPMDAVHETLDALGAIG
jgi:hypothetical protein